MASISQSLRGKPLIVDVSSNLIRVLFSISRMVVSENVGLFGQSKPTHRLLRMMPSALVRTVPLGARVAAPCAADAAEPEPSNPAAVAIRGEATPALVATTADFCDSSPEPGSMISPLTTENPWPSTLGPEGIEPFCQRNHQTWSSLPEPREDSRVSRTPGSIVGSKRSSHLYSPSTVRVISPRSKEISSPGLKVLTMSSQGPETVRTARSHS